VSLDTSRLTAIVRTCDRPKSIERLVRSIGWVYPQLRVLVADDSAKPKSIAGADVVRLPADSGVSACRNALLARLRTPYFLLLEEDMELDRNASVEKLLTLVAEGRLDVAAGDLIACRRRFGLFTSRRPDPAHATFEFAGNSLKVAPGHRLAGDDFKMCDQTHNYFVASTSKVRSLGGWDPQLAVDERTEFFVRAFRFGMRVGVATGALAARWEDAKANAQTRHGRDFHTLAVAKMGLAKLTDADGKTYHAPAAAQAAAA
jgi:hypothetical protein